MSKKKLESFKVAERHAPRVKPSHATEGKGAGDAPAAEAESPTVGFARIEAILDQEQPGEVQRSLVQLIDSLDKLMADARSPKERTPAKRAKMAVERTIDLMAYLFETKDAMLQAITSSSSSTPKASGPGGRASGAKRSK